MSGTDDEPLAFRDVGTGQYIQDPGADDPNQGEPAHTRDADTGQYVAAPEAPVPVHVFGVAVRDMGEGTTQVRSADADGVDQTFSMVSAHGALLAFLTMARNAVAGLQARGTPVDKDDT